MNISIGNFKFVPWLDFSIRWTDRMLYEKYNIDEKEQAYIESVIREME